MKRPASAELARAAKADAPPQATAPIASNNSEVAAPPHEIVSEIPARTTARFTGIWALVLAGVVGVVVGALLTYVKFRPAGEAGFRPTTSNTTSEDERRAALEKLLLGKKKHGSG
jgi:Tol biopolymer transport system component